MTQTPPPPPSEPDPSSDQPGQPSPPPPGGGYGAPPPPPPPPGGGYGAAPHQAGSGQLSQQDERLWAMLAHLGGIILWFIAPLVVMLTQGEKSPFVRKQAVEALNFQITLTIAYFVSAILIIVFIGILMIIVVGIGGLVLMIMAGIKANNGEDYRYPINIRLVK